MPVLGLQTASFADVMKTRYIDPLNDQVVRAHVLLDRFEKISDFEMSGNYAVIPLIMNRNPAVGGRKDTGGGGPKLPAHGAQTYAKATFQIGLHYGRGSVSGAVNRKSRDKAGAFAQALDTEMKGLMKSLPDDLNRQLCGVGNGRAASFLGNQGTSTLYTCDARDVFSAKINDRVAVANITTGVEILPATGATVVAITLGTGNTHSIEISAVGGQVTPAEDALYFGKPADGDASADMSWAQEIYGIQALVDDGNIGADQTIDPAAAEMLDGSVTKFGGITRSTTINWQSKVMANSGTKRTLTQNLLFEAYLHAISQGGAAPGDLELYMDYSVWGTLGMTQVGTRVYNDYKKTVEMGWEYIEVMGCKAFPERDLPPNTIFFLSMENLMLLTQGGYEMIDDDGNVLRMIAGGGYDAWEFSIRRDIQLAARGLKQHVKLGDLTTTMTVRGTTY